MSQTNNIPAHFQAAINVALSQDIPEFYTEGGCGVMAALLAEASAFYGGGGHFNLIMRGDSGRDTHVSHVTFIPSGHFLDLDVHGSNAEENWIEFITDEVKQEGGDLSELVFDSEHLCIAAGADNIQGTLELITEEHDLIVDVDWVRKNYPKLRDMLLSKLSELAA